MRFFPTAYLGLSTVASSRIVFMDDFDNGWQPEVATMTAQTENTYICGNVIDSIEIPTAKLGFSSMKSSKLVSPIINHDDDRQPEIAV